MECVCKSQCLWRTERVKNGEKTTKPARVKGVECTFNCTVCTMSPYNQMQEALMNSVHDMMFIQIDLIWIQPALKYDKGKTVIVQQLSNFTKKKQIVRKDQDAKSIMSNAIKKGLNIKMV